MLVSWGVFGSSGRHELRLKYCMEKVKVLWVVLGREGRYRGIASWAPLGRGGRCTLPDVIFVLPRFFKKC